MKLKTLMLLFAVATGSLSARGDHEVILTPERILHFDGNLQVNQDATVLVTETIKLTACGDQIKHGLSRKFSFHRVSDQGKPLDVGFELKQVLCNVQPEPYRLERAGDNIQVDIGRRNTSLSPGVYTYKLVYLIRPQLGFFRQYDELYWNVTGNDWPFTIEKATARVDMPPGAHLLQSAGYTGAFGAQDESVLQTLDEQRQPVFSVTRALQPGESLTVSASWPRGFVQRQALPATSGFDGWTVILTGAGLLGAGGALFVVLRRRSRGPVRRKKQPPARFDRPSGHPN